MRRSLLLNGGLGLAVVSLAVGGYLATGDSSASTSSTETVSTAERSIVLSTVSATGNVEAPSELGVSFQQSGRITSVAVEAGDRVKAGDELARIESRTLERVVETADAQLETAEAQLAATRRGLTGAERDQNRIGLAQAEASVANAERSLRRTKATAAQNEEKYALQVEQAEAQLVAAKETAEQNATKSLLQVQQAQAQLDAARQSESRANTDLQEQRSLLERLQTSYDPSRSTTEVIARTITRYKYDQADCNAHSSTTGYVPADGVTCSQVSNLLSAAQSVSSAESSLTQAQSSTAGAQRSVDSAVQSLTSGQISDKQQVASAGRSLASAEQSEDAGLLSDEQQVESAQTSLDTARLSLEAAKAGNRVKEASATTEQLAQAKASVLQAEIQVETAKEDLEDTILRAPIAGTVASISGQVGEFPTSGTSSTTSTSSASTSGFVVLTDLDVLDVKVGFTETDAAKVEVGQQATISIDALGGDEMEGTVLAVDLTQTVVNNVVTYYAKVGFEDAPDDVRPGMTASVSVVLDKREDVITLPTSAVPAQGTSTTVTVRKEDGTEEARRVDIGLRGDSAVELTSGLDAGEQVVSRTAAAGGGGGNPFGGGGGPGGGPPGAGGIGRLGG